MCVYSFKGQTDWFRQELIARFCEESRLLLQYNLDCNAQVMGCNMNVSVLHCSWLTFCWSWTLPYCTTISCQILSVGECQTSTHPFLSSCLIMWKKQIILWVPSSDSFNTPQVWWSVVKPLPNNKGFPPVQVCALVWHG